MTFVCRVVPSLNRVCACSLCAFIFSLITTTTTTNTTVLRLSGFCPGLESWYQKGKTKTSLDFLEQETVSGSGISWAICKSAPHSRQITTPAPHHSVFTGPDALPAAQATASKHLRQNLYTDCSGVCYVVFYALLLA